MCFRFPLRWPRVVDSRTMVKRSRIAILDIGGEVQHPRFEDAIDEDRMISKTVGARLQEHQDCDDYGIHHERLTLVVAPQAKALGLSAGC